MNEEDFAADGVLDDENGGRWIKNDEDDNDFFAELERLDAEDLAIAQSKLLQGQNGDGKAVNYYEGEMKESMSQAELRMKCEADLERQLKDCIIQCSEMYEEYTRVCNELNEQVESLDGKVRATSNEAGKCIDKLSKEIVQLGVQKRKVEDESEVIKTKLRELEGKTALYLKELDNYKVKCHGLLVKKKEKEMDSVEYESKLRDLALTTKSYVDELEVYKTALNGLKEQIKGLAEDQKSFSAREKKAEERIAYLQEVIEGLRGDKCVQPSGESKLYPPPNADRDEHVSGPTKENDTSLFKMQFANGANEKINFEIEERENAVFKQDNLEPAGIIQIGINEDDRDIRPKHTCDSGSKQRLNVLTGKKDEECGSKREAGTPLSLAPIKKRFGSGCWVITR